MGHGISGPRTSRRPSQGLLSSLADIYHSNTVRLPSVSVSVRNASRWLSDFRTGVYQKGETRFPPFLARRSLYRMGDKGKRMVESIIVELTAMGKGSFAGRTMMVAALLLLFGLLAPPG